MYLASREDSTLLMRDNQVVLQKKAKRVQKLLEAEGIHRIVVDKDSDEREGLDTLVKVTLARPIRFLFTEPIIMFSAACNGFIFGLLCSWPTLPRFFTLTS